MITDKDIQIVIPSRRRVESCRRTLELWPDAVVTVDEQEMDDYRDVGAEVIPHPPVYGLGELRQWILDNFDKKLIVQCNDDVEGLYCLVGRRPRLINDPQAMMQIILNQANIIEELGVSVFTFSPVGADIRKFWPQNPFRFNRIEGCLFGVLRPTRVHLDPRVRQHDDVDLTLTCLLHDRYVWMDSRFAAKHDYMTKAGGNSEIRGSMNMDEEIDYLRNKWGKYFRPLHKKTMLSTMIAVDRQQEIKV